MATEKTSLETEYPSLENNDLIMDDGGAAPAIGTYSPPPSYEVKNSPPLPNLESKRRS